MRSTRHARQRRPLRLIALTAALALALAGTSISMRAYADDGGTVFQDFESDAALAGLTVSLPQVDAAARAPFATHGGSSVRFTVGPASTPGATASAGITLYGGTASLPVTDWSGHAAFGFDFFTDLTYDTTGRVTIRDTHGTAWGANYAIHARGWTPFNVTISTLTAAKVDVSSISYVGISIPRADKPITGYYDAFRLADGYPYDQTSYGDRAAAALLDLCGYAKILTDLSGRLDRLDRQLGGRNNAIDERLDGLVSDEQGRVAALQKTLNAGAMSYDAYSTFNTAVASAQRAVPRLATTIQARVDAPDSDFGVESADSMSLVYPKDLPFTSTGPSPTVGLARGEYENVQAVVLPYAKISRTSAPRSRRFAAPSADRPATQTSPCRCTRSDSCTRRRRPPTTGPYTPAGLPIRSATI